LLLGCGISFGAYALAMGSVDQDLWKPAVAEADRIASESTQRKSEFDAAVASFNSTDQIGQHLAGNVEGRIRWLELMKAINECLAIDNAKKDDTKKDDAKKVAAAGKTDSDSLYQEVTNRETLYIKNLECQYCEDVSTWFTAVNKWYQGPDPGAQSGGAAATTAPAADGAAAADPNAATAAAPATAPAEGGAAAQSSFVGPKGPGWIVKLEGFHYHNNKEQKMTGDFGEQYVLNTLIKNLINKIIKLPNDSGGTEEVKMSQLGITYPTLVNPKIVEDEVLDNPYEKLGVGAENQGIFGRMRTMRASPEAAAAGKITLPRFDFTVHFCWQPVLPSQRKAAAVEAAKNAQPAPGAEQPPPQQ
jgi:type IV pilus assembly protein PilM